MVTNRRTTSSCSAGGVHAPSAPARVVFRASWRVPASSKTTRSSLSRWRRSGSLASAPTGRTATTPGFMGSSCCGRCAPARNASRWHLAGEFLGDPGVEAESGLERGLRPVADNLLGQFASAEHRHVRDASNRVALGQGRLLVDVDLSNFAVYVLGGDLLEP